MFVSKAKTGAYPRMEHLNVVSLLYPQPYPQTLDLVLEAFQEHTSAYYRYLKITDVKCFITLIPDPTILVGLWFLEVHKAASRTVEVLPLPDLDVMFPTLTKTQKIKFSLTHNKKVKSKVHNINLFCTFFVQFFSIILIV